MSNFYEEPFEYDGYRWKTIEHCFQAQKFKDIDQTAYYNFSLDSNSEIANGDGAIARKNRKIIVLSKTQLKKWDAIKWSIMEDITRKKYQQSAICRKVLRLTHDAILMHTMPRSKPLRFYHLERIRSEFI